MTDQLNCVLCGHKLTIISIPNAGHDTGKHVVRHDLERDYEGVGIQRGCLVDEVLIYTTPNMPDAGQIYNDMTGQAQRKELGVVKAALNVAMLSAEWDSSVGSCGHTNHWLKTEEDDAPWCVLCVLEQAQKEISGLHEEIQKSDREQAATGQLADGYHHRMAEAEALVAQYQAAMKKEPIIHSHITDELPDDHPRAYDQVDCERCGDLVHAANNECMTTWVEFCGHIVCVKCFCAYLTTPSEFVEIVGAVLEEKEFIAWLEKDEL